MKEREENGDEEIEIRECKRTEDKRKKKRPMRREELITKRKFRL
jgi:hypothetical protein